MKSVSNHLNLSEKKNSIVKRQAHLKLNDIFDVSLQCKREVTQFSLKCQPNSPLTKIFVFSHRQTDTRQTNKLLL